MFCDAQKIFLAHIYPSRCSKILNFNQFLRLGRYGYDYLFPRKNPDLKVFSKKLETQDWEH